MLTDTPIETANIANAAVPSVTGKNWVVRVFDATALPPAYVLVESKAAAEGSFSGVSPTSVQILGSAAPTAFTGILPFNGFGGTGDGSTYLFDLQNQSGGACAPAGPMRCPRIQIPSGGLVQLCDPTLLAPDTRAC